MKSIYFSILVALFAGIGLHAQAAGSLGDPAAPLVISEWVKGQPADLAAAKGKQIVVVEFWATWCPPCRASIPHLTELQKKFKDVRFVGVSDEDAAVVKKFVAKMGEKMDYAVAVDKERKTSAGYMEAYGIGGIPQAFIVDLHGQVVWNGHPMDGLEQALQEVVSGKFDIAKVKQRAEATKKLQAFYEASGNGTDEAKLAEMTKELETLDTQLGGIEAGKKFNAAEVRKQFKFQGLLRDYQMAMMAGNSSTNVARIEKLLDESAPKDFDLAEFKGTIATGKLFNDYMSAVIGKGDTNALPELTKKIAAAKPKDPRMLLQVAWAILDDGEVKTRDYVLAAQLAKSAVDATEEKDPGPLHVYARALFDGGKTDEAVAAEKNALVAAGDNDEVRKELEATLKKYQAKAGK